METQKKPKRRYKVDKSLSRKDMEKREKNAKAKGIPKLLDLSLAINRRLLDLGKNQEWLVEKTGIKKATISAYYNAESMPNGVNLIKLAKELETTPDYLLGYTDTPTIEIEDRAICDKTGLSQPAVERLVEMKRNALLGGYDSLNRTLSDMIEDDNFIKAIELIHHLRYGSLERKTSLFESAAIIVNDQYIYHGVRWQIEKLFNEAVNKIHKDNKEDNN